MQQPPPAFPSAPIVRSHGNDSTSDAIHLWPYRVTMHPANGPQALSAWAMWLGYSAMTSSRKVLGVILQSDWPTYGFLLAIVVGLGSGLALLATQWR